MPLVGQPVKRPGRPGLLERTYLPSILKGMWITVRHIWKPAFTRQYPEEKPPLYGAYRGAPTLVKDPEGRVKCVSCQLCEFVCPPKAIRITPGFRPEERFDANVEKEPKEFVIVAIDDESLYRNGAWPWSRVKLARLLDGIDEPGQGGCVER